MTNTETSSDLVKRLRAALELLAAEDSGQAKLHDLLETIREQIRLDVAPEHRPSALFTNIQNAVYAMRGRTPLLDDAAIAETLREAADALSSLVRERDEARRGWDGSRGQLEAQGMQTVKTEQQRDAWKARATAAEAERDEAREAAYDQPHGPTSRILWSTRYRELLDDYKDTEQVVRLTRERDDALATISLLQSQYRKQQEHDTAVIEGLTRDATEAELSRLRAENSAALSSTSEGGKDE